MITEQLLKKSTAVVNMALLPNHTLSVEPNSPLDAVIKVCVPQKEELLSTENYSGLLSTIEDRANSAFIPTGDKNLDLTLLDIDEKCVKPLLTQFAFVQKVVAPLVLELEDNVVNRLKEFSAKREIINTKSISIPDFYYDGFNAMVSKHLLVSKEQSPIGYRPNLAEDLTRDQFIQMLQTNSQSLNEGLMQCAALWNDLFEGDLFMTTLEEVIRGKDMFGSLTFNPRNFLMAVVAFVFANNLVENPYRGINLSKEQLNLWASYVRNSAARICTGFASFYEECLSQKRLIHRIDQNTNTVYLYEPIQQEFNHPDTIEIILGMASLTDWQRYNSLDMLNEHAEMLQKKGALLLEANTQKYQANRASWVADAIQGCIARMVEEANESEYTDDEVKKGHHDLRVFLENRTNSHPAVIREEVAQYLNRAYFGNYILKTELKVILSNVICELFFKNTMAHVILSHAIEYGLRNEKASQSEIWSSTVITILTEWVAGQIRLNKSA